MVDDKQDPRDYAGERREEVERQEIRKFQQRYEELMRQQEAQQRAKRK